MKNIKIKVKFFSTHREAVGKNEIELNLKAGITVNGVVQILTAKYPRLKKLSKSTILLLNHKYAVGGEKLKAGDEIALFPPVSGG
jgi:MoaD family protein